MKVYDLFPFFNELDLLELRLMELDPVVDVFGIVEVPRTFTDKPKPLYLTDALASGRFDRWKDKIRVHVPPAYPSGPHPTIDWFQRRLTSVHLHDAAPDDLVVLSDVDEIPNRTQFKGQFLNDGVHVCAMKLYYHRVDLLDPAAYWAGTLVCRRHNLGPSPDMEQFRKDRHCFHPVDSGWHFSWLGDGKQIAAKLDAVDIARENETFGAHGIIEPPSDPAWLQECYENGKDIFSRGRERVTVPIIPGVNQPHDVVEWLEKFPKYAV